MRRYLADAGPVDVSVYLVEGEDIRAPRPYARYKLADLGADRDRTLAIHGWSTIGPWFRADDVPPGHWLVAVEPTWVRKP